MDLTIVPVIIQASQTSISYLQSRGLSPRARNTREQLISAVWRVVDQDAEGPPIVPCGGIVGGGHYINTEVLTCEETIVWITAGSIVFEQIKLLHIKFDEVFLANYFGVR